MAFYGDPDRLDGLARLLEQRAEELCRRGRDMESRAAGMQWRSIAADRCRETIGADRERLDAVAERMASAAAVLRLHAERTRRTLVMITRAEEAVTAWFTDAARRFEQAVRSGAPPAGSPAPVWQYWPYRPGGLPPAGDEAWLDADAFLRRQGVL